MKKRKMVWAVAGALAMLALPTHAWGQAVETKAPAVEAAPGGESTDVGRPLDRFLERATVAADAAGVVTKADEYRREAERLLRAGRRKEARELLRRAGEVIAAAAPDRDAKRDDPFLREYLREVTAALVALDEPAAGSDPSAATGGSIGEGVGESLTANPRVAAFRGYWLGRGRGRLNVGRARLAAYRPMMARVFREEGVPQWLLAVGFVESTYDPSAVSPAQALGIWQFIPGTGARFGLQRTAWFDERQQPEKSTRAAARYLRGLHALFGDWPLALAAYNTGENRVARIIRQTGVRDFWTMADRGLLSPETINYVPAVLAASQLLGPAPVVQVARTTRGPRLVGAQRQAGLEVEPATAVDLRSAEATPSGPETDAAPDEQERPPSSEEETLEQVAERYNVPVSEIRQTVPGYYDIPSTSNGRRRGYVRVRKR